MARCAQEDFGELESLSTLDWVVAAAVMGMGVGEYITMKKEEYLRKQGKPTTTFQKKKKVVSFKKAVKAVLKL